MGALRGQIVVVALGTSLALCACGNSAATQTGVINLGMITPSSGVYGFVGPTQKIEAEVAANDVNNAGGVTIGNTKYTVSWTVLDDRSDPQTSLADAIQLFRDDNIKILFGPIANSAVTVAPLAAQDRVIMLCESATITPLLADTTTYPLLFAALPSAQQRGSLAVAALKKLAPTAVKVAWMGPNDALAQSLAPGLTAAAQAGGITWNNFLYPPGTTDLSTVGTRVKAYQPDAIFVEPPLQETVNVLNSLTAAGVPSTVPVEVFTGSPASIVARSGVRPIIIFNPNPLVDPKSSPGMSAWSNKQAAQAAKDGVQLTPLALSLFPGVYNEVPLVLKAMQQAGTTTDTAAIAKALRKVTADGAAGSVTYAGTNQLVMNQSAQFFPTGSLTPETDYVIPYAT